MKDRRGFLKLLGIGAGAAVAMVAARLAQTPTPAPRTIQDIEKRTPYIGPDGGGVPGSDYIKERPPVIPNPITVPDGSIEQPFIIQAGDIDTEVWEESWKLQPGMLIQTVDPAIQLTYTTSGTYDRNLGGYEWAYEFENEI